MAKKAKAKFAFNRVASADDFDLMGVETRKDWEVEMALATLRSSGAARPGAMLLGVGAATERTIYELANADDCNMVFATDLYLDMGVWKDWAGPNFLKWPGVYCPDNMDANAGDFDPWRIVPRHADMCALPFMDNTFDGVFSSGSIEHVGRSGEPDYEAISKAAQQIARVTKPGGIISLSTEWKVSGEGWGWSHVRLFDADTIMRVIVEASGCDLVDEPQFDVDHDLDSAVDLVDAIKDPTGKYLLRDHGFVFTSVHLALRKPA